MGTPFTDRLLIRERYRTRWAERVHPDDIRKAAADQTKQAQMIAELNYHFDVATYQTVSNDYAAWMIVRTQTNPVIRIADVDGGDVHTITHVGTWKVNDISTNDNAGRSRVSVSLIQHYEWQDMSAADPGGTA